MIKLKPLLEDIDLKIVKLRNPGLDLRIINGKPEINTNTIASIEFEDIKADDHPDYVDAYISYAEDPDGKPLHHDILDMLNDDDEYANWKASELYDYLH